MFDIDDRILIHPVDKEILPVIKSTANYPNIRLSQLISPESWGYGGESYPCAEGAITVTHDYEKRLEECSAVWFVDSWNELDFKQFIEPYIRLAYEKNKRIVCSRALSRSEKESLSDIEVGFVAHTLSSPVINRDSRVQEIRTPVIFVMSSTEHCNQFFVETAFCADLRNRGYEPLLISSRKEGSVFGQCTMPSFMFDCIYTENEKVIALNHHIRRLEIERQPEVIIIGVPGAAIPYDYKYSSDFGIIAYEISEAIKPDFAILASPCMQYDMKFFEGIEKSVLGRLGVSVDIHTLAPYALDFTEVSFEKGLGYLSVDDDYVQDMTEKIDHSNLLNLNLMNGISAAVDRIIDKLSCSAASLVT